MLTLLDQYEEEIYCKWKSKVDDVCQFNLDQPLIKRTDKDGLLSVNFDPELVAVLRDVRYLLLLGQSDIPRSALEMYKKRRTFDMHIGVLDLVVQWYNKIKQTVLEIEYPLIETELRTVDDLLMEAERTFTWLEENCWEYIEYVKATVYDLEERLQRSKDNIKAIQQIMKGWMEQLIFYRKDNKKEALLNMEDKEDRLSKKFMSLQEDGHKIHTLAQNDMDVMVELSETRKVIMGRVNDVITKAVDFKTSFEPYAYLWTEDRSEFMKQFLFDGHMSSSGETETPADIDIYETLYTQVSKLEDFIIFEGWFKVDMKPFLICLLNIIKKWSWMFKEYLLRFVIDSLTDLEEFIKMTDAGLQKELKEGDYNGLIDVMVHLMAVRDRQTTTNELFKPLKDTIILLESYGQKMPDHIYVLVEELPERWNMTKKLAISIKHEVAPLLTSEVTLLRKKCAAFDGKQIGFRERFRVDAPFHCDAKNPYALLDKANRELEALEEEMSHLKESANLFEVIMPDYKQMKQCRKEIQLLKRVWDINVYVTDIRSLDKEVRSWNVYISLEITIRNMLTSLRVITELQNPAMRDRHWYQLMDAIGVHFSVSKHTTLAELLALKLHKFEDDIRSIVDKAVKELGTEKILIEISQIWTTMEFTYEKHYRTNIPLLKIDEQLFETLDNNQVQLQTILQSKYVEYFIEQVLNWQKKLNVADAVIFIWMDVQRTWAHLETIFIGSHDIRDQLPLDARRFDGIDSDFKVIGEQPP
ncbi:UNVERIFIED_CONTAM: hypothetical protein K2H54_038432 [Gekko kuhli]